MKLWGYYALHTFLNTIKKMFRSTFLIVILACVGFGVIFGLVGGIVGSVVEQNSTEVSTEAITDENGDFKEDEQGQEEHMSPEDAALVKTCIEGVENEELSIFLRPNEASYYQGYYYSKPIPAEEFMKLL